MAHRSDRRGDTPITRMASGAVEQRLAPRVRISMMARSRQAPTTRPKIRRQSDQVLAEAIDGSGHGAECRSATKDASFVADQRKDSY